MGIRFDRTVLHVLACNCTDSNVMEQTRIQSHGEHFNCVGISTGCYWHANPSLTHMFVPEHMDDMQALVTRCHCMRTHSACDQLDMHAYRFEYMQLATELVIINRSTRQRVLTKIVPACCMITGQQKC